MKLFTKVLLIAGGLFASLAGAAQADTNTVAVGGYDAVSYQDGHPVRGAGTIMHVYNGATYLFATEENLNKFKANPAKYAPQYGGYCAFGASVGKKFVGDPTVWKVVDGKLYLNLSAEVAGIWLKDVPGNIVKADKEWTRIADVPAGDL
jgi:YHS domain-containing protein